jgi:hypothetical protein
MPAISGRDLGRNGTMVRGGFSSREWTGLFGHSHRLWLGMSKRLQHNVMFTRRGYVVVAESDRTASIGEESLATHRAMNVSSRPLTLDEFAEMVPLFDRTCVRHSYLFADGGMAPHHAVMKVCAPVSGRCRPALPDEVWRADGDRVSSTASATRIEPMRSCERLQRGRRGRRRARESRRRIEACAPNRSPCARPGAGLARSRSCPVGTRRNRRHRVEAFARCDFALRHSGDGLCASSGDHAAPRRPPDLRQWAGLLHASADFGPCSAGIGLRSLDGAGWAMAMGAPAAILSSDRPARSTAAWRRSCRSQTARQLIAGRDRGERLIA